MEQEELVGYLDRLGKYILQEQDGELSPVIDQAIIENPWFTKETVRYALQAIAINYLDAEKLKPWLSAYPSASMGSTAAESKRA